MAIRLQDKANVDAPAGNYPFGNIRDNDGSGNGTPVNKAVYADFHQFFAKLMSQAGIAYNNLPENNSDGFQYNMAVDAIIAAAIAVKANLNSPALTGTPTAPTAAPGTNTTQIATTAFIQAAIAALVDSSPSTLDTLNELADALADDPNFATTITNALALKAPLASPALTGTPTAPTAAPGTDTTQLATTAFIKAAIDALIAGAIAAKVSKAGDTMSGALTSSSTGEFQGGIRTANSGVFLKTMVHDIGDWDMNTTSGINVIIPGIADIRDSIVSVSVMIRTDNPGFLGKATFPLEAGGVINGIYFSAGNMTLNLQRTAAGIFDGNSFEDTSYNRGKIYIVYEA